MPPLKDDRFGCFHSKLMLLFHHDSVRVVIGSANMVNYDYEDMENVVFIQDFPLLSTPQKSVTELPRFARDIVNMLDEMQVPASVKEELMKYDFRKAKVKTIKLMDTKNANLFSGTYRCFGFGCLSWEKPI
jgi:tyrosyl-DNA phosphodiesterase-1